MPDGDSSTDSGGTLGPTGSSKSYRSRVTGAASSAVSGRGGRNFRQALVAIGCVVALIVTATAMPAFSAPLAPSEGGGSGGGGGGGGSGGSGGPGGSSGPSGGASSSSSASDGQPQLDGLPGKGLGNAGGGGTSPKSSPVLGILTSLLSGRGSGGPDGSGGLDGVGNSQFGALSPGHSTMIGGLNPTGDAVSGDQRQELHFRVSSSKETYWRTGSYDVYTGSGWKKSTSRRDVLLSAPNVKHPAGQRIQHSVTLKKAATSLPVAWRPNQLHGVESVKINTAGEVPVAGRLEADETYTVTSYEPPRDPSILRDAGTEPPRKLQQHYTQLPESTPQQRIKRLTDRITDPGGSQYAKARAIETWLESNKQYSLDVTRPVNGQVVSTFIFDRKKGYCEYFASSMVVMLRSQDIPARYVVGYSTGLPVGNTSYNVYSMNAHAWVEVYFQDIGWVRFDPTPGTPRLETEQRLLSSENESTSYLPNQTGSPNEVSSTSSDNYSLSVTPAPAPGRVVTAHVEKDGTPVGGVTVIVNGAVAGETNRSGNVTVTIPYNESVEVEVRHPDHSPSSSESRASVGGVPSGLSGGPLRLYAVKPSRGAIFSAQETGGDELVNKTYNLTGNMTFTTQGIVAPGMASTLRVTINSTPVRDALLTVDGEEAGRTNQTGEIQFRIPPQTPAGSDIHITAERGDFSDSATLTVHQPEISVSAAGWSPLLLPGQNATVHVTVGDKPVSNATVLFGSRTVGKTNTDGELTAPLPIAGRVDITAKSGSLTAQKTVSKPLMSVFLLLVIGVVGVGGGITVAYRRGLTPRDVVVWLRRATVRLGRGVVTALVWFGRRVTAIWQRIRAAGEYLLANLDNLYEVAVQFMTWFMSLPRAFGGAVTEWYARFKHWLIPRLPWTETSQAEVESTPSASEDRPSSSSKSRRTVRELWRQFVRLANVSHWRRKTPGEIAHTAIRAGLPKPAVETLTEAFREVEYGQRDPGKRVEKAQEAVRQLRSTTAEDTDKTEGDT